MLWLLPLHGLVQRWAREGRVTSIGFRHTILRHSWEEGTRWSGQLWPLKDKWMTHGASETWVLVLRERRINLLLSPKRSRRLLLRTDLRDRVVVTRAKAKVKVNHSGVGDTSGLLASQGRARVSIATSLDTLDGITLRGRDPKVMGHHNPNHQWDMRRRGLFLLTSSWAKGTGISPRVLHKHLLFCDGPHGPGHGLRSRTGLSGWYFRDPGACLRHYTSG